MKINKKILIPVLGTAMGLSVVGGISGAVAWYQYNSKVSASFVGASVADTGVLQIGTKADASSDIAWGRDINLSKDGKANLKPVTFGQLEAGEVPTLAKAYSYPESGAGEGYNVNRTYNSKEQPSWVAASENDFLQYELYFKAEQTDATETSGMKQVVRDVFLSDFIFESLTADKVAHNALRVMLNIENDPANDTDDETIILASSEHKYSATASEDTSLKLYGGLDLDDNDHNDRYHGTAWNGNLAAYGNHPTTHTGDHDYGTSETPDVKPIAGNPYWEDEEIVYGVLGQYQETSNISDRKVARDTSTGKMPASGETNYEKKLFSTLESGEQKVTVTVWLEGWEVLKTGESTQSAVWNAYYSAGTDVQVGLQFDSGIFRGEDLNA